MLLSSTRMMQAGKQSSSSCFSSSRRRHHHHHHRRPLLLLRPPHATDSSGGGGGGGDNGGNGGGGQQQKPTRYSELVKELTAMGMTPGKARATLKAWADLGAKDAEQLKQLLVSRSQRPLTALGVQAALDLVASAGGAYVGHLAGQADFPGGIVVSLLGYFFGCLYFIQAVSQVAALTSLALASRRYSTDAQLLLEAVRQLAGPGTGLSIVDSAALAVNALRVVQTLETIGAKLRDVSVDGSLANLSAYLTLQRAEELYGFVPAEYGLTEREAAQIAGVFALYDSNDDGRLEQGELRSMCARLGQELSDAEAKEAVRLLDGGGTGYIQFGAFVEWYQAKRPSKEAKAEAALRSTQ